MNADQKLVVTRLLAMLEECKHRPAMICGGSDIMHFLAFRTGLDWAYDMSQLDVDRGPIYAARGWTIGNFAGIGDMQSRGLDERAIVTELIDIEINALDAVIDE